LVKASGKGIGRYAGQKIALSEINGYGKGFVNVEDKLNEGI